MNQDFFFLENPIVISVFDLYIYELPSGYWFLNFIINCVFNPHNLNNRRNYNPALEL